MPLADEYSLSMVGNLPSASRRELLAAVAFAVASSPLRAESPGGVRAIAFDAFVLFDPSTIVRRAVEIMGDKAEALVALASMKLFGYTWLYTSAGRYAGFQSLAREAFAFAARASDSGLNQRQIDYLVAGYSALEPWPDVQPALDTLRRRGVRLCLLSNLPDDALGSSLCAGRIERYFEQVLSTDRVKRFKPAPEAYALATSAFALQRQDVGFAASAGWDAAGATWFGFPTAWVNRNGGLPEDAHAKPFIVSKGMEGVLALAGPAN